jgi:hypothetical protein
MTNMELPPELETPSTPEEAAEEIPEVPTSDVSTPPPVPASAEAPQAPLIELPVPPEGFEDPFMQDWDDEEMAARQTEYERLLADAALDEEEDQTQDRGNG